MKLLKKLFVFITLPLCVYATEAQLLVEHVKQSIENAKIEKSKLTEDILNIGGKTSSRVKHLLNNVCSLPSARYLEIGVFQGSTFISALYQNTNTLFDAIAIDNWSEFGYQKTAFTENALQFLPQNSYRLYEQDSFSIYLDTIFEQPIDIYFYDGNHSREAQRQAFTYYNNVFADVFIAIVDDWNWEQVKTPTKQAFEELGYTILFEEELPARYVGDLENWWNGIYIAVIQKN